jgi:NTE family protein
LSAQVKGDDRQKKRNDDLALVLGGGGAHAAYQVGFLRCLARHYPDLEIPILTGVSAGAINAVFLANHSGPFRVAVEDLAGMWQRLTIDQVFRTDSLSLLKNLLHWQAGLMSGGFIRTPTGRGLVDTMPLRKLLQQRFCPDGEVLKGIETNLRRGRLKAVAITGTDYRTDQAATWVQGEAFTPWQRTHRRSILTELTIDHIMASAALPLFFPAIRVQDDWYGDGGMRQTNPLSPALHLGANRILAVSTRHERPLDEKAPAAPSDHPPPAQVIGTLLNSIFLDLLVQDARTLERINRLVRQMPETRQPGARRVDLFLLQPSCDIGELSGQFRHHLPKMLNFLIRGLGTHRLASPHWLSIIMFDALYLGKMLEIGEADAEERIRDIAELVES